MSFFEPRYLVQCLLMLALCTVLRALAVLGDMAVLGDEGELIGHMGAFDAVALFRSMYL